MPASRGALSARFGMGAPVPQLLLRLAELQGLRFLRQRAPSHPNGCCPASRSVCRESQSGRMAGLLMRALCVRRPRRVWRCVRWMTGDLTSWFGGSQSERRDAGRSAVCLLWLSSCSR
jgi:hypothetical protein